MQFKPALLIIVFAAMPLLAHHSFTREYDSNTPVALKGSVTMLDFSNPHSWVFVNVKDERGSTISWGIELGPVNNLKRQGWSKTTLKPGTIVWIEGYRARNGSPTATARTLKGLDGKILFTSGPTSSPQSTAIKSFVQSPQ
jgi:hypothetical protein